MRRGSPALLLPLLLALLPGCSITATLAPEHHPDPSPEGIAIPAPDRGDGQYEYRDGPRSPSQVGHAEAVRIRVTLPPTADGYPDLLVPRGRFAVNAEGVAEVLVANADAPLTPILLDPHTNDPIAIAYLGAREQAGERALGSEEILLGCMYLNPGLILTPADARDSLLRSAPAEPGFGPLLEGTHGLLAEGASGFLSRAIDSGLFEQATRFTVDLHSAQAATRAAIGEGTGAPYLDDLPGAQIEFVNPRLCAYGVEIRDEGGALVGDAVLYGKQSVFVIQDGWPPVLRRDPVRQPFNLGNGRFSVTFYKGFNFMTLGLGALNPETAAGRATIVNMLNLVGLLPGGLDFASNLADSIADRVPEGAPDSYLPLDILEAMDWLLANLGDLAELQDLEANIGNYRLTEVIRGLVQFILADNNLDYLAQGLWDSLPPETTGPFLVAFQRIMRIVDVVFAVIDFANMGAPFIYDFFAAPFITQYEVEQTDGVLAATPVVEALQLAAPRGRSALAVAP